MLVERNNHGHSVLRALRELGTLRVLDGWDEKPGWLSNVKGKPLLYNLAAPVFKEGDTLVRSSETATQLASIEASTLRAPSGLHDDLAMAYMLALAALTWRGEPGGASDACRNQGTPEGSTRGRRSQAPVTN